jgi:Ring finger domain
LLNRSSDGTDTASISCTESDMTDVVDHHECSICLEQFQIGDVVSTASINSTLLTSCPCPHVFHHICVKEWLLKQNTCPACRAIYCVKDHTSTSPSNISNENEETIVTTSPESCIPSPLSSDDNENDNAIMFYCIQHGVVHHVPKNCHTSEDFMGGSISSYRMLQFLSSIVSWDNSSCNLASDPKGTGLHSPSIPTIPTPSTLAQMRIQNPPSLSPPPSLDLSI